MAQDRLQIIQEFVSQARALGEARPLRDLIADTVTELGFRHFAIIHHVAVTDLRPGVIQLSNYPAEWIAASRAPGVLVADPVIAACQRRTSAFDWSELESILPLTEAERRRLASAKRHGLANGLTVPLHIPGEVLASASFSTADGREVPPGMMPVMQTFAQFAFEAARRINRDQGAEAMPTRVPLTERQRECVVLSAQGKSDWVAAKMLGLSPKTVNRYIEAAKLRYAVATRQQLIVHALFGSEITFAEVITGQAITGLRAQASPATA